jgi:hypothetical protein
VLTLEFKNAYQYTKGLINKNINTLILIVAFLIPFVNIFVLIRYVDKIVREPSSTIKPPNLVKPDWTDLVMSMIKILVVALFWGLVALVLILPVGFIFGVGALGGFTGLMNLVESFSAKSIPAAVGSGVILCIVGIFAVMSLVNMLKTRKIKDAFAFKDLLGSISKIGWLRYILYVVTVVVVWAIILFITAQVGNLTDIGIFTVSVAGILALLPATFLARTISVLYDQHNPPLPPPPP